MIPIARFTINNVNHPICRECDKFEDCTSTCIAVEMLVKLAQMDNDSERLNAVSNLDGWLDLENSFH